MIMFTNMVSGYLDPSVMTYAIQAIAGVVIAIGAVAGIYWRKAKKKVSDKLGIDENKNNIALMKVFGYKKKEINSMMLNGSRIYVVIGYIIGVPIGYFIIDLIFKIFAELDIGLEAKITLPYILIGFVIIALTFEISKAICSRKIEKIALSEALKTQKE